VRKMRPKEETNKGLRSSRIGSDDLVSIALRAGEALAIRVEHS
jgi:hypothetical protein